MHGENRILALMASRHFQTARSIQAGSVIPHAWHLCQIRPGILGNNLKTVRSEKGHAKAHRIGLGFFDNDERDF